MLKSNWSRNLEKVIKQRNGFFIITLGLLITNILMGVLLFNKSERVIIVPAYFKQSFWNQGELVSNEYIEEMSLFFTKLMLDTTPDSHKYRKDVILRYVAPEHYHKLEERLFKEAEEMYKQGVSTSFATKQIKVNSKKLSAEVTGTLTRYISGMRVGQSIEVYELEFGFSGGIFMLKNFKTKEVRT